MRVPFAIQAYQSRALPMSAQEMVNCYAELVEADGKNKVAVYGTPGTKTFGTIGDGPIRGLLEANGVTYAVSGNEVYVVDNSGGGALLGTISNIPTPVIMSSNGMQIGIVDTSNNAWYINNNVITQINDPQFLGAPNGVSYLSGFTLWSFPDRTFQPSAVNDITTYDILNYATAESDPDALIRGEANHNEYWLFGTRVIEIWQDVGNVTIGGITIPFPFQRLQGGIIERGCGAQLSIVRSNERFYWLGNDKNIYRNNGYTPEKISSFAIDEAIRKMEVVSDAQAFAYTMGGHKFYCITFPTANVTFSFDENTELWHTRQTYDLGRWIANCHVQCYGKQLVGSCVDGKIYELDLDYYWDDNGEIPLRRVMAGPHMYKDRNRLTYDRVEVEFESGVGAVDGQGTLPTVYLEVSTDGGRLWSTPQATTIGRLGDYKAMAVWYGLGQARQMCLRVSMSDPVKWSVLDADVQVRVGRE